MIHNYITPGHIEIVIGKSSFSNKYSSECWFEVLDIRLTALVSLKV